MRGENVTREGVIRGDEFVVEGTIDLTVWEGVSDRSVLPGRPTPFTWSVLAPTLAEAYRRAAGQLNVPWPGDDGIFCLHEGRPYQRRGLSLDQASREGGRGGLLAQWGVGSQGNKSTEAALASAADYAARTTRWYDRVRQTHWGQADLLQVMEEIENLGIGVQALRLQLAVALRTAQTRVQQWQEEAWPEAAAAQVTDLTGHVTAYEQALAQAASQRDTNTLSELMTTYGYRSADELELAAPRWAETAPGISIDWPTFIETAWVGWKDRQRAAEQTLAGRVGFLKRRGLEADVQWRRRVADTYDDMDDARARWLAGTRIWANAAAQETVADKRIANVADIFLLELEEVKQLMTGEWNVTHRESLQELVAQRKQDFTRWQSHA